MARLRSGWLRRRLPAQSSFDEVEAILWSHRFDLDVVRERYGRLADVADRTADVLAEAERNAGGSVRLYGWAWCDVGFPPAWHRDPFSGADYPLVHWSRIGDDDAARGDIKDVWELSRLQLTVNFVRAHAITGDDRWVELWWQAVEDWATSNPPSSGVNWRCGQESSLRAITLCFGLSALAEHPASTPERLRLAGRLLAATASRVRPTVGYALSQRNNHAISELVFLLSLPGPVSRRHERLLAEAIDDQFDVDGSYSQQSFVYQRLAVTALVWLVQVQPKLGTVLRRRIERALDASRTFLERTSDPVTGALPNYGPNDGSALFGLWSREHLDGRPTLAMLGADVAAETDGEVRCWFDAVQPLSKPPASAEGTAGHSSYVTLRGTRSMLLTRIGSSTHRAADDDQQAVELFLDGRRVVIDPGTFRYSGAGLWRNPFTSADLHSGPRPMSPSPRLHVGRFLRTTGEPARLHPSGEARDDTEVVLSTRRDGAVVTTRSIVRQGNSYAISDSVQGGAAIVRWNLAEKGNSEIRVAPAAMTSPERDPADPRSGWWSQSYAQLTPCRVVEVRLEPGERVTAVFAPEGDQLLDDGAVADLLAAREGRG